MIPWALTTQESLRSDDINNTIHEEGPGRCELLLAETGDARSEYTHRDTIVDSGECEYHTSAQSKLLVFNLIWSGVKDGNSGDSYDAGGRC